MRILITGANGFIGKEVLKLLSKKGFKIIATYNKKKPKIKKNQNIKWKKFDIFDLDKFKFEKSIDIVIHLAWPFLPDYQNKKHLTTNLSLQKKFVKSLIKNNVKNYFFAGTCYEYGKQNGKLSEKNKRKPNNPYAKSKSLFYEYLSSVNKKEKLNITWGRIFYIYGYNNKRDTLYNLVINKNKRKKLEVASNFYRDYLDIKTLAKIIVTLSLARRNYGIVNLCSGFPISLRNLIKYFFKINNIKDRIIFKKKENKLESNNFYGKNKKLKKILKQNLSDMSFKKILKEIIKHK